jgi:NADPH:quinone reductase-like Zn-dependent oxidoreductase
MDTMMAVRAHRRGGPEQLVYEQAPVPVAGPGEALVAVHAAGITFAELTWDETWTTRSGADRTPVIPAHDISGTVAALGEGVTGLAVGQEVYGLIDFDRDGGAAEYAVLPAIGLAARPRSLSHPEAATLPLSALTAWQALVDHAGLVSDELVAVLGGAGGVGVYAVQLAATLGGHVLATGSARDAEFVLGLGAERYVSARAEFSDPAVGELDIVIDTVGGAALEHAYGILRYDGRLVTLGAPPSQETAALHGVRAMFFIVEPDRAELTRLAELADARRLVPVISQTFPLAEARRAYESGAAPRPPGKTVLIVR